MEIGILIVKIVSVLCILIDGWAMLRVRRAYQDALKKEETCRMFGETIAPYIRITQYATACIIVCIFILIIFQEVL